MPRQPRKHYPHQYYHVFNRGFDRKTIFKNKDDYLKFLSKLEDLTKKYDWIIYSYCLLPNHYHLHIQTRNDPLFKIIHSLQTSHAVYFNRKHHHTGPVFTNRYKSILIQKENYHVCLSKYIHLNPVNAGLTSKPQNYPYSSYPEIIGKSQHPYKIIDKRTLKSITGSLSDKDFQKYREFIEDLKPSTYDPKLAKRNILGSKRFRSYFE